MWLEIAQAVGRLSVVITPCIATVATVSSSNFIAALSLLCLWLPFIEMAMRTDFHSSLSQCKTRDFSDGETMLLVVCTIKTLSIMTVYCNVSNADIHWIAPIVSIALFMSQTSRQRIGTEPEPEPEPEHEHEHEPELSMRQRALCTLAVIVCSSLVAFFTRETDRQNLAIAETVLSVLLFLVSKSKSTYLTYAWFQLAVVCLDTNDQMMITHIVLFCFIVLVVTSVSHLPKLAWDTITTRCTYELIALVSAWVVCYSGCTSSLWYTSNVTFPDTIASVCTESLYVVDNFVRYVYTLSSSAAFQQAFAIGLSKIGQIRANVYHILQETYTPLMECSHGKVNAVTPSSDILAIVSFAPLALVCLSVLVNVAMPSTTTGGLMNMPWLWGAAALCGVLSTVYVYILADVTSIFWSDLFASSTYVRTYTNDGTYAAYALIVFTLACVSMYVLVKLEVATSERLYQPVSTQGTQDKATVDLDVRSRFIPSVAAAFFIVATVLLIVAMGTQLPIERIYLSKQTDKTPSWLLLTTIDRLSSMSVSLVAMLSDDARSALLVLGLIDYALNQVSGWPCLLGVCVSDILPIVNTMINLVTDGLGIATTFIITQIVDQIPFASVLDAAMHRLADVSYLIEWQFVELADDLESVGHSLTGALKIPQPSPYAITIMVAVLVAMLIVARTSKNGMTSIKLSASISIAISVVASCLSTVAFYVLANAVASYEGYNLNIVWSSNIQQYNIVAALYAVSFLSSF